MEENLSISPDPYRFNINLILNLFKIPDPN